LDRADTISVLQRREDAIRQHGAVSMYLFGSTGRGEASPSSDIDLFIDHDPASRFSLFDLAGLKAFLEEELRTRVDLTTRDSLHPELRADIEGGAIRIF